MIVPRHYENLDVLHENTMPNRAYYIPASKRMNVPLTSRAESDRITMLNGMWKFKYYESIYDVKEKFYETGFTDEGYDRVEVPGVWQNYGYDNHQYTNVKYPIPMDPPYVPQENPCGTYICEFEYQKDEKTPKTYLNFEGVDSCYYVWLNGTYVGYSQVSHATGEFDISHLLCEGKNRLAVLVLKWCDGTYMEDQDKFRMSGIFRDVYLIHRPENVLFDYFTTTQLTEEYAIVNIVANYRNSDAETQISLYDDENQLVVAGMLHKSDDKNGYTHRVELQIENPILWSAENPYLYTVVMETEHEVITDRVGIREIYVKDCVVYVNHVPIKFRGVNRHDSDPVTGFVVGLEQMKMDLSLMKQHNFNAIRSSHYPNVPYFYQLCDEYGFYVMDEADNESHGTSQQYLSDFSGQNTCKRWNERIADNPKFIPATVDRIMLCVHRDKNRPCVVIWSMGNECSYGCTFEVALKWTKTFDPTRLTHYEGARYRDNDKKYDFSNLDLYSRMYPSLPEIREYVEGTPQKPFILVEYCHAMGNGPGDLEDYYELIHDYDIMCGGFVWEWSDHAIYKGEAENGRAMYYYGGDHNEVVHDGNFCMDGLVYPDRTPHTGLLEYKNVHRPVRVVSVEQEAGTFVLENQMDFVDLKDYIYLTYEVNCDGTIVSSGKMDITTSILPHEQGKITMEVPIPKVGKSLVIINYHLKHKTPLLDEGYVLGFDEISMKNQDERNQTAVKLLEKSKTQEVAIQVAEDDRYLTLQGKNFQYVYNKLTGLFHVLECQDENVIDAPMEINIWRAPTDNDGKAKEKWMRAGYHRSGARAYHTEYNVKREQVEIRSTLSVAAVTLQKVLQVEVEWIVMNSGEIYMKMDVQKDMAFPELPRFGLRFFLKKDFENVTFYGMGPQESYIDKCKSSRHSVYHSTVKEMHEDYIYPQENGSHVDCDYVVLESETMSFTAVSEKEFSFNVSPYTQEELTRKKHNFELVESESTILCLDYAQNGIGSNSCGPVLLDRYKFNEENFTFEMKLMFQEKRRT